MLQTIKNMEIFMKRKIPLDETVDIQEMNCRDRRTDVKT
jgi:hypothetical protein